MELDHNKELYTVGEIWKINNMPVKTLRYYDGIGLLKPDTMDEYNNYTYIQRGKFTLAHWETGARYQHINILSFILCIVI